MSGALDVMLRTALGEHVSVADRKEAERQQRAVTSKWEDAAYARFRKLADDLKSRPVEPTEDFHTTRELAAAEEMLRNYAEKGGSSREVDDHLSLLEFRIPAARKEQTLRRSRESREKERRAILFEEIERFPGCRETAVREAALRAKIDPRKMWDVLAGMDVKPAILP